MINQRNKYSPDVVSPPGEVLQEFLDERSMTQSELARRMGRPTKTINEIINGKTRITPETSLQLELATGVSAQYWTNHELRYREYLARIEYNEKLEELTQWAQQLPLKKMKKLGWLKGNTSKSPAEQALQFFGVSHMMEWPELSLAGGTSYRNADAFSRNPAAVAAWLRQGYNEALEIECAPYQKSAFLSCLKSVRRLTFEENGAVAFTKLQDACRKCGVAVVAVEEIPRETAINGAARWLSAEKALIQVSFRGRRRDIFWFTFFHEASHIVLHRKKDFFVDTRECFERVDKSEQEQEADAFAQDLLIEPGAFQAFVQRHSPRFGKAVVKSFSESQNIAWDIVIGRLVKEGLMKQPFRESLIYKFSPWNNTEERREQK